MADENISGGRNYGIDLFRCVSMIMIVMMHTLNQGGVLGSAKMWSAEYIVSWFLMAACYGAVNSYALISGYVGWNRKWKPSRVLSVWAQVLFYTLVMAAIFLPTGAYEDTAGALKQSFFPIFMNHYWYITAYVALMVLAPFLNRGIASVTKREAICFVCASLVIFMVVPRATDLPVFGLSSGYSVLWLVICYIYGGLISRFGFGRSIPWYVLLIVYLVLTAVTSALRMSGVTNQMAYISPAIFIGSASLCILFSKMRIGEAGKTIVGIFSPATLGVYIIHTNYFVWNRYIYGYASGFTGSGVFLCVISVLAAVLMIYLVLSLCDIARMQLFRLVRLDKLIKLSDRLVKEPDEKSLEK